MGGGYPILARWTTDYDCDYETEWWYCILDKPFDVSALNAKKRYEINKGNKNFFVKIIDPLSEMDEIVEITRKAYLGYPIKYRPVFNADSLKHEIVIKWNRYVTFAAYNRIDNKLCGYALITESNACCCFNVLKSIPEYEKLGVNFALINGILSYLSPKLNSTWYLYDGERNVIHQTKFQDFLIKYYGFRKAYCSLNISYNPRIKRFINILYIFRNILKKFDNIGIIHSINGVLLMEGISRNKKS